MFNHNKNTVIIVLITTVIVLITAIVSIGVMGKFLLILAPHTLIGICPESFCAPKRDFNVLDMTSPDTGLFSEDTTNIGMWHRPSESYGAFENGSKHIYWDEHRSSAYIEIWRYALFSDANEAYEDELRLFLPSGDRDILGIQNMPNATKASSGCGIIWNGEYQCGIVARYSEYVVVIRSAIDPQQMPIESLKDWIALVDTEFESKLTE